MKDKTGKIALTAGNSSRSGRAEQLLQYKEKGILSNVMEEKLADYEQLVNQLIPVHIAQRIIDRYLPAKISRQYLPLTDAFRYTLAADVTATVDIPFFVQSSMDGYAIRFADRELPLQIVDKMAAGITEKKQLKPGQAIRIFTGAPLPFGADTVVMQEKVQIKGKNTLLLLDNEVNLGSNVRPKGSEIREGTTAMVAGEFLSAAAIGFLAGIGCSHVEVFAAPKVAIILTGNELQEPGQPLAFGQVYESNSFQIRSALARLGIYTNSIYRVKDDIVQLQSILKEALHKNDCIILVGGVSVGDYDYVTKAAENCGVVQRFHRVRQKPGKPLFFGTKSDKLVFGLPGNPSSALTCFYVYLAPTLEKMMRLPSGNRMLKAKSTCRYEKKAGLTHFLNAYFDGTSVTPLPVQESYRLHSFSQANCLLILDEGSTGCEAGDEVEVQLLSL